VSLAFRAEIPTYPETGIGLAFVQTALAANAKVIVADLAQTDAIKSLGRNNPNVRFKQCDVGKWADLESLIAFSESEFGDVPDVFAANAGIMESVCIHAFSTLALDGTI
jgi:NAD(P)-dependent dehydrogenase (short-subunit alcohol dehydrogenase family)